MINLTHLTKRFSATVALDDVTFSVAPGTIVGFLGGPNGAGKIDLPAFPGWSRPPDSGEATVNGILHHPRRPPMSWVPCSRPTPSTPAAPDAKPCGWRPSRWACPRAASTTRWTELA